MKKIFACLLVVLLVLSMCACTKQVETAEPERVADTTQPDQNSHTLTELENIESEWTCTWSEAVAPNGNKFQTPGGFAWMVAQYDGRTLWIKDTALWMCDQETGFTKLSGEQQVINYTVAYDTVYWFNLDREVWAVDWYTSTEAYLFCEDAIAVSPYTDEAEGAVVTPERANWESYGLPIYSPYGK